LLRTEAEEKPPAEANHREDSSRMGERYFYRHPIFTDDPEVMAGFDGGKGYLHSRV
jgi:hypothetical protein